MYEHKDDNKAVIGIIVLGFVILTVWLCHDYARNKPIYHDTDVILDTIEVRVDDAGKRIEDISGRVSEAEKAISSVAGTVTDSQKSAEEIANGIRDCEKRLDEITQRQGRINNLIADIEAEHRKGKKNP